MVNRTWDIALSKAGQKDHPMGCYNLPAGIGRALIEADLWRATLEITKQGILIRPYKGERRETKINESVILPDSWTKDD